MSTINSVGSANGGWSDTGAHRAKMREKLFSKADADGSGGVDASALQSLLDRLSGNSSAASATSASTSATSGDGSTTAADLLQSMDRDGNGSLDASELDAGLRALMGPPPSTMQFAQSRSGTDDGDMPGTAGDSSGSDTAAALAQRLAAMVMHQYAPFSAPTSADAGASNLRLAA